MGLTGKAEIAESRFVLDFLHSDAIL